MRVYNKDHPSELTFMDETKGEYNITHRITNQEDDDIATALMLFKVGEITLDESVCYFGYRSYQEGYNKTTILNHDRVSVLVREATSTMSHWG